MSKTAKQDPTKAPAEPADIDPAVIHTVIQRPMATPVLRHQGQPGQAAHRAIRIQHRVRQLAQLIGAGGQAGMKITPEPRQHGQGLDISGTILQAVHHGLRW